MIRHHLKPTTAALQRFGNQATCNILDLSDVQVVALLHERSAAFTSRYPTRVCDSPARWPYSRLWPLYARSSALPTAKACQCCALVSALRSTCGLGLNDFQCFARANKPGAMRVDQVHNRCSDEMLFIGADFCIDRLDQIIQSRGDSRRCGGSSWGRCQICRYACILSSPCAVSVVTMELSMLSDILCPYLHSNFCAKASASLCAAFVPRRCLTESAYGCESLP